MLGWDNQDKINRFLAELSGIPAARLRCRIEGSDDGGHYFKRQTSRMAQHLHREALRVVEAIEASLWSRI